VELVFSPGNTFLVNTDGSSHRFPKAVVVGLQTKIIRVRTEGEVRLMGARMMPFGVRDWQADKLQALAVDIEPLLNQDQFQAAVNLLREWLLRQPLVEDRLVFSLRKLYAEAGNISIADLAASGRVTSRQLQRDFGARLGASPKTLARLVRFAESWSRMLKKPDVSLAELALELGYADQAHFSNEFSSIGKQSPRSFWKQWGK